MSGLLKRFRIEALHNIWTIDAVIADNRLVLVGENGTGKSTFANFVYFFLTRQWHRMLEHQFRSISAVIDSTEISLARNQFVSSEGLTKFLRRRFPSSIVRRIEGAIIGLRPEVLLSNPDEFIRSLASEIGIPYRLLADIPEYMLSHFDELGTLPEEIAEVSQTLTATDIGQVLYLPTYRRIEQDLRSIFPGVDEEIRSIRKRLLPRRRRGESGYVELVEFGMQDVENTIMRKVDDIKDNVRTGLSALTGTYLRDVIQGAYRSANLPSILSNLDDATIDAIFSRIPKAILSEDEQKRLRGIIETIEEVGRIDEEDKVVAHFLAKLIELHKTQQEYEREVRDFVGVCNSYLSGKEMVYDDLGFEIYIRQQHSDERLSMKALSSGEKQIVSLFSHMYLSGREGYFVIIDEPELSLSVPWQRRFLPDILNTGRCNGLIAVTHSPFVYENELDAYAHSIGEFMVAGDELS